MLTLISFFQPLRDKWKMLITICVVALGLLIGLFVLQQKKMDHYIEEGYQYESKGQYEDAFQSYLKAAELGDVIAQNHVAVMYDLGRGVAQSKLKALQWHIKAAKNGHADSQNILGIKYEEGDGFKKSDHLAMQWYGLAAKQGFVLAQRNLAQMYEHKGLNQSVNENMSMAIFWYELASKNGDAYATKQLKSLKKPPSLVN